jgi:benzoyl-CoA reductase/2-hydroxyglutaryl-CoA dehydratase subunit BcrC/BadD/HgdB
VFSSKIKNFPYTNKEKNYNRFIDLFFNFYEFVFFQTGQKIDKKKFLDIKKKLLKKADVFFLLFYSYQEYNNLFLTNKTPDNEFYKRLFADELKLNKDN